MLRVVLPLLWLPLVEAAATRGPTQELGSLGEPPPGLALLRWQWHEVEAPYLVALWILVASLAKIGECMCERWLPATDLPPSPQSSPDPSWLLASAGTKVAIPQSGLLTEFLRRLLWISLLPFSSHGSSEDLPSLRAAPALSSLIPRLLCPLCSPLPLAVNPMAGLSSTYLSPASQKPLSAVRTCGDIEGNVFSGKPRHPGPEE